MEVLLSLIHLKVPDGALCLKKRKLNYTGDQALTFPFVLVGMCREEMVYVG